MSAMRVIPALVLVAFLPLALGQGCPLSSPETPEEVIPVSQDEPPPGDDNGSSDDGGQDSPAEPNEPPEEPPEEPPTDLTDSENDGINAALYAVEALSQAATTSQNSAGATDQLPSQFAGDCPDVTTDFDAASRSVDITIDFGNGCGVLGNQDYICSGSASGTGSIGDGALIANLTFADITCIGKTLSGAVSLEVAHSPTKVTLAGDWNLTIAGTALTVTADGTGTCTFEGDTGQIIVSTFDGAVSVGTGTYDMVMADILVSFSQYDSLIPYGGTIYVSGASIRDLEVVFDANSPVAGDVQVSIDGGPFFTVNLFDLL